MATLCLFDHQVPVSWLPTYCSDLNPIEHFWHDLKDLACANKLQDHLVEIVKAAEKIIACQNDSGTNLRFHLSKDI